jgi:hypothetical protein
MNFSMLVGIVNVRGGKGIQQVDCCSKYTHTLVKRKTDIHSYYGIK